jgi:hypothetical protein
MTETATAQSPAEIDGQLAALYAEINSLALAIEKAEQAKRPVPAGARNELASLVARTIPLTDEFERVGGWTRYYLVEGGHLHRNASAWDCSRTMNTSQYWMTELSGQTEAEVIELAGDRVCTVCYPAAPVAVLGRPSKLLTKSEAEKAEAADARRRAADDKAAKAAAAAITDVDGSPLKGFIDTVRTEREATSQYRDTAADLAAWADTAAWMRYRAKGWTEADHLAERDRLVELKAPVAERLLAALAHKHGVDVETERATHAKPVAAKVKRNAREAERMRAVNAHFYAEA